MVVAGSLVVAVLMNRGGSWWPDHIQAFSRLSTPEAKALEDEISAVRFGGLHAAAAMYGNADGIPELVVERFEGDVTGLAYVPIDSFFQGAVGGMQGIGGDLVQIDTSSTQTATVGGTDYECAPASLNLGASVVGNGTRSGALCAWKGSTLGLLIAFDVDDPAQALTLAEATAAALQAPH